MLKIARYLGLFIIFAWFFGGGIMHFVDRDFFVAIVPPWFPWPVAAVYISGVFEIVLALMILVPAVRSMAGWGLIVLTIAVTPANIHMWLNPELFPEVPETFLTVRLIVQVILLWLIWWSTRMPAEQISDPQKKALSP